MGISSALAKNTVFGDQKVKFFTGSFANTDTTGDIDTGFAVILFAIAQYDAAAKIINCSASGGTLTLATQDPTATKTFTVMVVGH